MRAERGQSGNLCESARRVMAMAAVISCHLGLLMLLLRPASYDPDRALLAEIDPLALNLRFIPQPRPPQVSPSIRSLRPHGVPSARVPTPLPIQRAALVATPPPEARPAETPTTSSTGDGGFQERLRNAQRSYAIHGVPGSDTPSIPGIHLIDPMSQGVGSVMRSTQRLFGVTNRHCIDVDVWRHLSPQELSARHISLRDVDRIDGEYRCNSPLGLSI